MSLFNTHSDANKIVKSKPVVKYDVEPYYHEYSDGTKSPIYWKLKRSSNWNFEYVGMTEEAAIACAEDVRAKYLLTYMKWEATVDETIQDDPKVTIDNFTEMRCSANIQAVRINGDDWGVKVTVEDSDEVISTKELKTLEEIEAYFQEATSRKIVTGRLNILDAHWSEVNGGVIQAKYYADIDNFDPANVTVKVKQGTSWVSAVVVGYGSDSVTFTATLNKTFKIFFGEIESKEFTTTDVPGPEISLESITFSVGQGAPPSAPGQRVSPICTFNAICSIHNGLIYAPNFDIRVGPYGETKATSIEALGGTRYRVTSSKHWTVSRDFVFLDGSFSIGYSTDKSFSLSNEINFSTFRDQFAKIGRIDCVGWYIGSGETTKTWRLRVHANAGFNISSSSAHCYPYSKKWDGTETRHITTWSADTEPGFDYVCTIDVREANSEFNQGIYIKYTVGTEDKYSEAVVMPLDGGPITP